MHTTPDVFPSGHSSERKFSEQLSTVEFGVAGYLVSDFDGSSPWFFLCLRLGQLTVTLSDTKLVYVEDLLQNQRGAYQEDANAKGCEIKWGV